MKFTKKHIGLIVGMAVVMFLLAACSSESRELRQTDSSIEMITRSWSATETLTVTWAVGTDVLLRETTRRGTLDITIVDLQGNAVFSGVGVTDTMNFRVPESGEYTIRITVNSHSGRISLSW